MAEDEVHFEHAAKENRVLVTNDRRIEAIANRWLEEGRAFRGLILWPQSHYQRLSYAQLVSQIEALSEPFPHPVTHLKWVQRVGRGGALSTPEAREPLFARVGAA